MSKPKLETLGGIYNLTWEAERVSMRIDRLREDSGHEVKAEVLIQADLPGVLPHVHQARLNLTSTAARASLVRLLVDRVQEVPWDALVEQACVMVLQRHRQGEPVIALADVDLQAKLRYRVKPFVTEGEPSVLFGPGGVGKSTLATYWAVLTDAGINQNGIEPEPGRGLYLDYEASAQEVARRERAIRVGLSVEAKGKILYRFCVQPLAAEVEEIQRIVVENGIQFIVVDSAGPACGGEPEAAGEALRYFAALRALRVTSLTVAHVAKHGGKDATVFGSVFWQNIARNVFEVRKVQEAGADSIDVGLFHRKCNTGKLLHPRGFRVAFEGETSIKFSAITVSEVPEFESALPCWQVVERILKKEGQATAKSLAEATGRRLDAVRQALERGRDTRFRLLEADTWGLATRAEKPPQSEPTLPWEG